MDDGHYVTVCKQPNKRWMLADDARVMPSTEQEAKSKKINDRKGMFTPYLLIYKRILQYTEAL